MLNYNLIILLDNLNTKLLGHRERNERSGRLQVPTRKQSYSINKKPQQKWA